LENANLAIAVQDLGYKLTTQTSNYFGVMHCFATTAATVVGDLENVFEELFSPSGEDRVALENFDSIECCLMGMRMRAFEMNTSFEKVTALAKSALEMTQRTYAARRTELTRCPCFQKPSTEPVPRVLVTHQSVKGGCVHACAILTETESREWWANALLGWFKFIGFLYWRDPSSARVCWVFKQ
jgi:hypothetical protein